MQTLFTSPQKKNIDANESPKVQRKYRKKQKVSIMTLVDTAFERENIHRAGESSLYAAYKANLRN